MVHGLGLGFSGREYGEGRGGERIDCIQGHLMRVWFT
jgi:hypothetical protein